jgi:putative ATP-dependent endonuclease of OLD family
MLTKIVIQNFRTFRNFSLEFGAGMNILVGNNDVGKSTLLQAVHLALTSRINGKAFMQELSPFHFTKASVDEYLASLSTPTPQAPPEIIIDLFLEDSPATAGLRGSNNLLFEDSAGVRIRAHLNDDFVAEYQEYIAAGDVTVVPTEYYAVEWLGFSGNGITYRSIPATASLIDASAIRLNSGADYYLGQIITNNLQPAERVELARAYRSLRETFSQNATVTGINDTMAGAPGAVSDRKLSLSIDISTRASWESSLVPHLDELPFQFVGKGEQSALKILLALNRRVEESHIVLIEEPENHMSFSNMNKLIDKIAIKCADKQVLLTTHSSYVLNKLGLDNLILLNSTGGLRISGLTPETGDYFRKLSGYDTLRLVLAEQAILVEGPSDELVVQRAYLDAHQKLPISNGIDVIDVGGIRFKRFLEIAKAVGAKVKVVTDNDGKDHVEVAERFEDFTSNGISIHVGIDAAFPTLEPQLVAVNDLSTLNSILGKSFTDKLDAVTYMTNNKTTTALAIFQSDKSIVMPKYINDAVA